MIHMVAIFQCLESKNNVTIETEIDLVVYEKEPVLVIDSKEFKFSNRAKKMALRFVRSYLEGWDGIEFDGSIVSEY